MFKRNEKKNRNATLTPRCSTFWTGEFRHLKAIPIYYFSWFCFLPVCRWYVWMKTTTTLKLYWFLAWLAQTLIAVSMTQEILVQMHAYVQREKGARMTWWKMIASDGGSRLGLGLETCLETRFLESRSQSRRSQVSSWSRRISVSVSSSSSRDFA